MLIVKPVGPGVVRYLVDGRDPGRWTPGAGHLLGLRGAVATQDLEAVLLGRDPLDGRFLPEVRRARRRAGWDLMFCAPKSFSLLALSHPGAAGAMQEAHRAAVDGVLEQVQRDLTVARLDRAGAWRTAEALIGASFDHVVSAAGEPHLHTHAVVVNLTRAQGRWSAVRSEGFHVGRVALGALYQLGLRHHAATRDLDLEWRLRPDGLADVAGVARGAVRAVSSQSRLVATVGRFEARRRAVPKPWRETVDTAGLRPGWPGPPVPGPAGATAVGPGLRDPGLARAVATRLAAHRSDFRRADVVAALAACFAGGATPEQVGAWVDGFCAAARPVPSPTVGRRWTTELARRADDQLVELLTRTPGLTFLTAPAGESRLLGQAELLDAWHGTWNEAGRRAAVASPSHAAAERWLVLARLPAYRAGEPVDVLVIDQADRRSSGELSRLARAAVSRGAHLVFVEGGTMPRLSSPASRGLVEVGDGVGRLAPGSPPAWRPLGPADPERRALPGRAAAEQLLGAWLESWVAGRPALLVGLGVEEVRGLNDAARRALGRSASAQFRAGDRVVLLRRRPADPDPGHPPPSFGSLGTIIDAAPRQPVVIRWDDEPGPARHRPEILAGLGHGYAVSPGVAARTSGPLALLGPARAAPRLEGRLVASVEQPALDRGRELWLAR